MKKVMGCLPRALIAKHCKPEPVPLYLSGRKAVGQLLLGLEEQGELCSPSLCWLAGILLHPCVQKLHQICLGIRVAFSPYTCP